LFSRGRRSRVRAARWAALLQPPKRVVSFADEVLDGERRHDKPIPARKACTAARPKAKNGVEMSDEHFKELHDGTEVPVLALGVWQVPEGDECVDAVQWALEAGYRHIDTAQAYGNERSVGEGIRRSGVPRDEVFVTTKFNPSQDDPVAAAEQSLERLGLDRIDLYIIHWPAGGATWAWPGMEQAKERGYARSIGVSNFSVRELDEVVGIATQVPTVNQIHLNPFAYRRELLDACARYGIAAEAYSPLGTGRHLGDATVAEVAARAGRTPAQVLVRWGLQRGFIVLPKSTHKERIEENGALFDFALPDEDMTALDALDRTGGTGQAVESKWWR